MRFLTQFELGRGGRRIHSWRRRSYWTVDGTAADYTGRRRESIRVTRHGSHRYHGFSVSIGNFTEQSEVRRFSNSVKYRLTSSYAPSVKSVSSVVVP